MTKELEDKIYEQYPALYRQKDLTPQQTCMCWGLSVGDGWYAVINYISEHLTRLAETYDVVIEASQVKEKFGTLRFYYDFKLGKSWTYKPTLFGKVLTWLRDQAWLWKLLRFKHGGKPTWIFTAIIEQQNRAYKFKGKTKTGKNRYGWDYGTKVNAYKSVSDQISEVTNVGELMSGMVCEDCGSTVDVTTEGPNWVTTTCDKCRKAKDARNASK